MLSVELNQVSISFPIYSASNRSLKNVVLAATTGGSIGNDANHVVVQALNQVSLSFKEGDRVGLIGHNGAGKSTLLRVIAGIFVPREGTVKVNGRVTPMFDLTLGMDSESTGHENIILRGLYLGLSKKEILRRRDEVAAFTELGPFLDLPVRTYSAGMLTRLTFAMATCIEPEILVLDEGIGAGDAMFLEKANQRLDEFIGKAGIMVLASHSVELLRKLCNKTVVMEKGHVVGTGDVEEGLAIYHHRVYGTQPEPPAEAAQVPAASVQEPAAG